MIEDLREGIYAPLYSTSKHAIAHKKFYTAAHKLYKKLIGSVELDLPEKLIIVPDGIIGYLPFDVLLTDSVDSTTELSKYPFMLMKHQFSYVYSATLWMEMLKKQNSPSKTLLAFAPLFESSVTDTEDILTTRKGLGQLMYNIPEVEEIRSLMGGTSFTGKDATRNNFLQQAKKYQILHLSTHGKADDRAGDYCFLAFQGASLDGDSLLYARDLYNIKLNADLVVLSACETGIGELQRGEGILSMAKGFTYAGAKSIISTLWGVNDKSTQQIMSSFYKYLKEGLPKDEALHKAKIDYVNAMGSKAFPYYWAGFIAIGDMEAIQNQTTEYLWLGLIILTLSVSLMLLYLRNQRKST